MPSSTEWLNNRGCEYLAAIHDLQPTFLPNARRDHCVKAKVMRFHLGGIAVFLLAGALLSLNPRLEAADNGKQYFKLGEQLLAGTEACVSGF